MRNLRFPCRATSRTLEQFQRNWLRTVPALTQEFPRILFAKIISSATIYLSVNLRFQIRILIHDTPQKLKLTVELMPYSVDLHIALPGGIFCRSDGYVEACKNCLIHKTHLFTSLNHSPSRSLMSGNSVT